MLSRVIKKQFQSHHIVYYAVCPGGEEAVLTVNQASSKNFRIPKRESSVIQLPR